MALATGRSKALTMLLVHYLLLLSLFVFIFCVWSLFFNAIPSVLSSLANISLRKGELVALLYHMTSRLGVK